MKYKRKLHPSDYALGENEKFYGDMEAKGWRLVKRGAYRSKFERVEPARTRYRVEVADISFLENTDLPEEQIAVYEDCGWEYVTSRGIFHYFRAPEGSDAPEFYQDPRQQAETLKKLRRRLPVGALVTVVLVALLAWMVLTVSGGTVGLAARVRQVWLTVPGLPAFWCLQLTSGIAGDTISNWQISRTYRRLKKGIPLDHAPKSRGRIWFVLVHGLRWAADLCLVLVALRLVTMQRGAMPVQPDGPYIVLSDVGWTGERTTSFGNTSQREHTRTFLSEYWDTREYVENPGHVETAIYQDVYRLAPWLDPMDWVDSLTVDQTFVKDLDEYTPVDIEGLDAAWLVEGGMEAVAVKGQMMAYIDYLDGAYSTEQLTAVLEALAARWAAEP